MLVLACQPSAQWTEGVTGQDGRAIQTLTLKNVPGGSRVWFQELFDNHEITEGPVAQIHHYQGTSFYFDIPEGAGSTVTLCYKGRPLPRHSWAPEGFVLQRPGKKDLPIPVSYTFAQKPDAPVDDAVFTTNYAVQPADLIPRPKQVQYGDGPSVNLNRVPASMNVLEEDHPAGWYRIRIESDGAAHLEAGRPEDLRYAATTLEKLPDQVPEMTVEDWPDFQLRGFMLDVVRDFRSKEEVFKILDIMASYKLNLLHFHLGDDESWCLEMKPLPELTTYGAHHELPDWDLQESRSLKPQASGRIGTDTYYSQEDYKDILRYAWERGIAVVPEFDAPGHSRAAVKSTQAYEKRTGDDTFRLQDPADTSHYWTAQDFTDNVLSVELPGVYKFFEMVFDEVIRLHKEAGVPLWAIHIGGDEVPSGAWEGKDRSAQKDFFTRNILDLAQEKNLKLAGWQEMAQGLPEDTAERLKKQVLFINAWSTRGKKASIPYELANAGFPVLLSNVQHCYVDLAYSPAPEDRGLHWGGYVNERSSFALQPWHITDDPLEHPENIVGAEALLWSENIRCLDHATYQMLPKALGVWERAWNASPDWPTDQAFEQDFDQFYSIIVAREMPWWDARGFCYKKR